MKTKLNTLSKFKKIGTTKLIIFSFLLVIFIGTILLSLPISNTLKPMPILDNLFMATSATCVTGLTTFVVAEQYNIFGQIIVLILIQIGGLGLMSFIAMFYLITKSKFGLFEKTIVKDATNALDLSDIKSFIKLILKYTFILETIGAILIFTQFMQDYSLLDAIFKSIFLSISAFCNAGIDTIGSSSLQGYTTNIIINYTVMFLIITGGLGFIVFADIKSNIIKGIENKYSLGKIKKKLLVQTKLVLVMTILLLVIGTIGIFILEYNFSLKDYSLFDKITISLFNSTTLRTAGFSTINYGILHKATLIIMCLFMLIGGSPGGTAGGLKTTTFAILIIYFIARIKGIEKANIFKREISIDTFFKATIVLSLYCFSIFIALILLLVSDPSLDIVGIIFEIFSAIGTVGLSTGITSLFSSFGKVVIIILMFIGRIGPISLTLVIFSKKGKGNINALEYPKADILVG